MAESKEQPNKSAAGKQLARLGAKTYVSRRKYDDLLAIDESTLEPGVVPRWVSVNEKTRIARHKLLGYEFAREEDGIRTVAGVTDNAGDGTIRVGDAVLMICHQEHREKRRAESLEASEAKISSHMTAEEYKAKAARAGVKTYGNISVKIKDQPD